MRADEYGVRVGRGGSLQLGMKGIEKCCFKWALITVVSADRLVCLRGMEEAGIQEKGGCELGEGGGASVRGPETVEGLGEC